MTRGTMIIIHGTTPIGMTRGMVGAVIIRSLGIVLGIITVGITDLITGTAVIIGDIGTDIMTATTTAIGILIIGMTGATAITVLMDTGIR